MFKSLGIAAFPVVSGAVSRHRDTVNYKQASVKLAAVERNAQRYIDVRPAMLKAAVTGLVVKTSSKYCLGADFLKANRSGVKNGWCLRRIHPTNITDLFGYVISRPMSKKP